VGDRFDMRLYDDVTEDMMLDGWVDHDVTPELAKEVFLIWKSEYELEEEEFKEQLDSAL